MKKKKGYGVKELFINLGLSILAVFAPIHGVLIVCGIVIMTDLVTGIIAAKRRGEKINSAGLRRSISKIFVYQFSIIIAFLIEVYLMSGVVPISKIVAGLIGITEATSIFENLKSITGYDIFSAVLQKLGSVNDNKKPDQKS